MTAPEPFLPRVFRAQEDGTVAVESYVDRDAALFRLVYTGPTARRLGLSGRLVTLEFLLNTSILMFRELKVTPPYKPPKQ